MRQDWSKEDIAKEFEVDPSELEGIELLYSYWDSGGWDGSAFIIFRKDGELYEVNASHCSCHGFEDQWGPEKTSIEALKLRLQGTGYVGHREEISEFLRGMEGGDADG